MTRRSARVAGWPAHLEIENEHPPFGLAVRVGVFDVSFMAARLSNSLCGGSTNRSIGFRPTAARSASNLVLGDPIHVVF